MKTHGYSNLKPPPIPQEKGKEKIFKPFSSFFWVAYPLFLSVFFYLFFIVWNRSRMTLVACEKTVVNHINMFVLVW